jgi:OPA family glycerol-3-phosphate transporter-like MFS transporter
MITRPAAADRIDPEVRLFIGIFIGYAAYYLVRKNFSLAIPDILKDYPQYTKAAARVRDDGAVHRVRILEVHHGQRVGRSNPRWFMTLGLLLTAQCARSCSAL